MLSLTVSYRLVIHAHSERLPSPAAVPCRRRCLYRMVAFSRILYDDDDDAFLLLFALHQRQVLKGRRRRVFSTDPPILNVGGTRLLCAC